MKLMHYSLLKIQSKQTTFEDLLLGINTVDEITFYLFLQNSLRF